MPQSHSPRLHDQDAHQSCHPSDTLIKRPKLTLRHLSLSSAPTITLTQQWVHNFPSFGRLCNIYTLNIDSNKPGKFASMRQTWFNKEAIVLIDDGSPRDPSTKSTGIPHLAQTLKIHLRPRTTTTTEGPSVSGSLKALIK